MEFTRSLSRTLARPMLWGFFVLSLASGLLVGVRFYWQSSVRDHWSTIREGRERQIQQIVSSAFYTHVRALLDVAQSVKNDRLLWESFLRNTPTDILQAFDRLDRHRSDREISIDIVDGRGSAVLWAGNSGQKNSTNAQVGVPDTVIALTQSGLHTYLSVTLPVEETFLFIVVRKALEVNYPISNRFVTPSSFVNQLSHTIGREAKLSLLPVGDFDASNYFVVPLKDHHARIIGAVVVSRPTVESELQSMNAQFDRIIGATAGIAILLLTVLVMVYVLPSPSVSLRLLLVPALLWSTRYAWLVLGFPRLLLGTSLFDPAVYGTPFGGGITETVGETLITIVVLVVHLLWVLFVSVRVVQEKQTATSSAAHRWLALTVPLFIVVFFLLTQGYGEALRSFVFDSTLRYHDPTVLVPRAPLFVMHVNILLLTVVYLVFVVTLQGVMVLCIRKAFGSRRSLYLEWTIVLLCFALLWVVLQLLPVTTKFPTYYPLLSFIVSGALLVWLKKQYRAGLLPTLVRNSGWLVVAAFIVALPLLDQKLHQKDRQLLQLVAEELLQPVDSWLSLVINEGLRTVAEEQEVWELLRDGQRSPRSDVAFSLWSHTLVGREGYNSALVVYDAAGNEVSRFTVGLTSFEQTEMLKAMFNAEEEVLQVVERKMPTGSQWYYGAWSTVRDRSGEPVGIVALMLSANQRSLFRSEAPEPLRTATREPFERHFRDLFVSEFQRGVLTSTNNSHFYRGMLLAPDVLQALQTGGEKFLWRTESMEGREYESLYVRDDANAESVLLLNVEIFDIRWHLFNGVKVALIFFAVWLVLILLRFVLRKPSTETPSLGFRARLITAFGMLTAVPLILLGYYNRELATERLESAISRRLGEDLTLLERRMAQTFVDEEDFLNGMTDDYCETVASELGIDFSVFRSSQQMASSKPELYHAAILDSRLPGRAYANTVLIGKNYFEDTEQIGEVRYTVGYKPLVLRERIVGVLAVQALYRQREIDAELAQRNVYTVGVYTLILLLVIVLGFVVAHRLSLPLRQLTVAAREVGRGNLQVRVAPTTSDEVGELMESFNEMVAELRESREQIARAERELAWKEMAKQVAHEIKNPLTPMKLSLQHLRRAFNDRAPDFPALLEQISQTVVEQIDALSRIASEFSNFARMPERSYERVDVHQLLRETITLFQEIRGVEFRTKFSDTTPVLVADRQELQRVFINLIRNSIQAMEQGGTISLVTSYDGHRCVIHCSDTGPGIPPDIQQKVFEPNFSTKTDGAGLGLAIARRIIEDLDGTIELSSEIGKGTTFTIRLPAQAGTHA